jgi:hypothetical protein
MARETSSKDPADKTPSNWKEYDDIREKEGSGQYPNYWVRKTRSGHTMIFDDSKDKESITIQHRSGAMIQFLPDGAVQYVSHNGQQNIVFGENRILVTGAQDSTVRGDSSTVTHGEVNTTVHGGMHTAVGGAMVTVAESNNQQFTKHNDVKSESQSTKVTKDGSAEYGGAFTMTSQGGLALASDQSGVTLRGKTGVGMRGESALTMESPAGVNVQGGQQIAMDAPQIHFNSGKSKSVSQSVTVPVA